MLIRSDHGLGTAHVAISGAQTSAGYLHTARWSVALSASPGERLVGVVAPITTCLPIAIRSSGRRRDGQAART
jgi:hypothetical protein